MRILSVLLLLAIIGAAAFVYDVKYRTTRLAREASQLEQQIETEKDNIAALRAEWSTLNQPARLQALVKRHLSDYQNLGVTQMAFAYELPERPLDIGTLLTNLDAQKGLETPIDKKDVVAPLARKVAPTPVAKARAANSFVSPASAAPMKLIPVYTR
ncbi:MAG: hypothetical protein V4691_02245 [Pseudomonadota bacterium]